MLSGVVAPVGVGLGAPVLGGASLDASMLNMIGGGGTAALLERLQAPAAEPSVAVVLKNMFDPNGTDETNDKDFFSDLKEDIQEECGKYGAVDDCRITTKSAGHVYMKFNTVLAASAAIQGLNSRWFAGKQIAAEYLKVDEFPTSGEDLI